LGRIFSGERGQKCLFSCINNNTTQYKEQK